VIPSINMAETGILENLDHLTLVLLDFEPGPFSVTFWATRCRVIVAAAQ
jgi:hypothetical protein